MCSTASRSVTLSNRRGTSETPTPSSSQCLISRRRTSLGAVEKVTTRCSMPCCSIRRSRSQLAPRTGHGQARGVERLLVEEPDRPQAELGVLLEPARGEPADAAGADDQRRLRDLARAAGVQLGPVESDPAGGEVEGAEGPEADRLAGELVDVPGQEDAEGDEGHAGEDGRGQDGPDVVEDLEADAPGIHAARVEGEEDEHAVEHDPGSGYRDDPGHAGAERRGEPGREQHRAVEREGPAGPGRMLTHTPENGRVTVLELELDRLENRYRFRVQRSRSHVAARRNSVRIGLGPFYFFARPSARIPVPAASSAAPPAVISARSRPVNGSPPRDLTACAPNACWTAPWTPTRG